VPAAAHADSTTDSTISSLPGLSKLPAEGRLQREALCLMLQELAATLCHTLGQQPGSLSSPLQQQHQWQQQQQQALSRQQQLLLQEVCLNLPQVLLRIGLLFGDGQPQFVSAAVGAATWAMIGWRMARHAAGTEWKQEGAQLMMPGVIDAWLFLAGSLLGGIVQQQQQQQPRLLFQVAATGKIVQRDSTAALELGRAGKCSCAPDSSNFTTTTTTTSSSSFSCVSLDCVRLMAVDKLLVCLGVTPVSIMGACQRDWLYVRGLACMSCLYACLFGTWPLQCAKCMSPAG
jgi:hypothetical protein